MLTYQHGGHVRLVSRNTVDHTHRFRELAAAVAKLKSDTHTSRQTSLFGEPRSMRGSVWLEPRLRAEVRYADVVIA
jgi:hypothetical protein